MRLILCLFVFFSSSTFAEEAPLDLERLAQDYFQAMVATQMPEASSKDLEAYLAFLTDDVGHSHLPWVTDDSRSPDGKAMMREGMTFYLGAHTDYQAKLLDVFTFNSSAIAIRYENYAKGIHPESKQAIEYRDTMMEVLELEGDKVAVIRKYHQ